MQVAGYEGLVGWRYLLRPSLRPQVLLVGLPILLAGAGLIAYGAFQMRSGGGEVAVFSSDAGLPRTLMAIGGGISAFGFCLTLFGLLNLFLTVFAAFSTFMVTIGVAEVILVLGVMNGFQGDLRGKIIDTHAHVVVEPAQRRAYLADYARLAERVRAEPGVIGASPILRTEVMLSSATHLSAIILAGVEVDSIGQTSKLPQQMKRGSLEDLRDPTRLDRRVGMLPLDPEDDDPLPEPEPHPRTPAGPPEGADGGATGGEVAEKGEEVAEMGDADMAFPAPARARPGPPPSLIVGAELRRNLGLWSADVVNVVSPMGELGPEGPVPTSRPFRLSGWFESGMLEFDTRMGYARLGEVQRFLGIEDVAGSLQIRVADLDRAREIRDALRARLGPDYRVTDWQERNHNLFSALKLEKIAMFLVLTINILLAAFSITSTLVMTIIERKREVAILMAMGSTPGAILRIFMAQGALTGVLGSAIGAGLGLGGGYALASLGLPINTEVYYISAIPVDLRVTDVIAIVLVAISVSLVSTLYPAHFASRLNPVEGLNAE